MQLFPTVTYCIVDASTAAACANDTRGILTTTI